LQKDQIILSVIVGLLCTVIYQLLINIFPTINISIPYLIIVMLILINVIQLIFYKEVKKQIN